MAAELTIVIRRGISLRWTRANTRHAIIAEKA